MNRVVAQAVEASQVRLTKDLDGIQFLDSDGWVMFFFFMVTLW